MLRVKTFAATAVVSFGITVGVTVAVLGTNARTPGAASASTEPEPRDPDTGERVHRTYILNLTNGMASTFANFSVPSTKRLVIEQVSARGRTGAGDVSAYLTTRAGAGTFAGTYFVVFGPQGTFGGEKHFTANHPMRAYANAGTQVTLNVYRSNTTGPATFEFTFSGYLLSP